MVGESDFEAIATFLEVNIQYRPVVDLFERLKDLASLAALHINQLPSLPKCLDQECISVSLKYLRDMGLRRRGVGRGGNPAAGLLDKSPIASALMQSADHHCKPVYDGMCIILILYFSHQKSPSSAYEACREIRLSARAVDPRNILLSKLPSLSSEPNDYLSILRERLKSLEADKAAKTHQKLFYVLQNLANIERTRSQSFRSKNDYTTAIIESKSSPSGDVKLPGKIKQIYETTSEPGEPPSKEIVFESDVKAADDPIIFDFAVRKAKSWVQKSETLSRVDTSSINELEKSELVKQLKLQLEKDFNESVIGFAVVLVYLLGLDVTQVINTRWSAVGFIDLEGRLIKTLPEPPKIFRSDINSTPANCFLPLPDLAISWLEKHAQRLAGSDSLLAATAQTEYNFLYKVRSLLGNWRRNGRYRLKLSKLTAALSAELTYQTRDPLVITTIAGDLKTEPPVLMYYRVLGIDELTRTYQKATNVLLNIPEDLLGLDFGERTQLPGNVRGLVEGISANLKTELKHYPANIIQSHNALMYFTLIMMMFATGHRPVRDPFCYWGDFDIDNEGVLISDKVVSPRHEYRYQVISKTAQEQLETYRRHLRQLGARLYRDKSLKRQQLGVAILSCVKGSSKHLPVFFELDESAVRALSITQKSIQTYWTRFVELPANAGRSVMCQLLVDSGVPLGTVELYLGHIHGLSHRHGPRSGHEPVSDFVSLAKEIDRAIKSLGWRHISPYRKNRDRIRLPKKLKQQLFTSQSKQVLGPEKRRLQRLKRQSQTKEIVANARTDIFTGTYTSHVEKEQVNEFFNRIKSDCHDAGLSIQNGVNLGVRWLAKLNHQGVSVDSFRNTRPLPAESSVISRGVFDGWQQCKNLRTSLLKNFSSSGQPETIEQALAELVVTAAIFGGLANSEELKRLPEKVFRCACLVDGMDVIIELNEQRWVPDPLSLSRMIYLRSQYHFEQVQHRLETLQNNLVALLKKLGLKCSRDSVYQKLSALAQALNAWHLPGALQGYWMPSFEGRHLPLHRFSSLLSDQTFLPECDNEKIDDEQVAEWLPALKENESVCLSATQYWQQMKTIFSEIEGSVPIGADKRNRALRAKLAKQLKAYAQQREVSITAKILIAWLVARCRSGLAKENLAFSTIKRYASEIVYPILALSDRDLRSLDQDALEALYWACLETCDSDKSYRVGRLYDFHEFLKTHLSLPTINWSVLYAFAGFDDVTPSVDANILSINEYDKALQIINDEAGLTSWLKARYMAALILGFRFGLRFGEVIKLRAIDVQRDKNKVFLQIRGTVFGDLKTRAGVRQIPLIGQFNELENVAWEAVLNEMQEWVEKDHQTLLLFDGESPRKTIDKQQAQDFLNKLLKHVSADHSLRFHHLRHSFANRLMAYAYPLSDRIWKTISRQLIGRIGSQHLPLLWSSIDEPTIKLQAIADVMGHASIKTTMSSYFHFPELLGRAISNQYVPNLTPKVMASLMGQSESTLQKRRERSKSKNSLQAYFAGEPINKLLPSLNTQFQTANQHEPWCYDYSKSSKMINLQQIDRLLVKSARMQNTSIPGNYENTEIDGVLRVASLVQAKTGYRFYQVPLVDPDAIVGKEQEDSLQFQENVLEAERLDSLMGEIDQNLTGLVTSETQSLTNYLVTDLATWREDRRYGKSWRFSTKSGLSAFIEILTFLPLKEARFKLLHPPGELLPVEWRKQQGSNPSFFEMRSDNHLQKEAVLKLISLPPRWKTLQTLNRVVFCLIVWLHLKADTDSR